MGMNDLAKPRFKTAVLVLQIEHATAMSVPVNVVCRAPVLRLHPGCKINEVLIVGLQRVCHLHQQPRELWPRAGDYADPLESETRICIKANGLSGFTL